MTLSHYNSPAVTVSRTLPLSPGGAFTTPRLSLISPSSGHLDSRKLTAIFPLNEQFPNPLPELAVKPHRASDFTFVQGIKWVCMCECLWVCLRTQSTMQTYTVTVYLSHSKRGPCEFVIVMSPSCCLGRHKCSEDYEELKKLITFSCTG